MYLRTFKPPVEIFYRFQALLLEKDKQMIDTAINVYNLGLVFLGKYEKEKRKRASFTQLHTRTHTYTNGYEHTETRSLAKQKRNLMKTNVAFACSVLFFPTILFREERDVLSKAKG